MMKNFFDKLAKRSMSNNSFDRGSAVIHACNELEHAMAAFGFTQKDEKSVLARFKKVIGDISSSNQDRDEKDRRFKRITFIYQYDKLSSIEKKGFCSDLVSLYMILFVYYARLSSSTVESLWSSSTVGSFGNARSLGIARSLPFNNIGFNLEGFETTCFTLTLSKLSLNENIDRDLKDFSEKCIMTDQEYKAADDRKLQEFDVLLSSYVRYFPETTNNIWERFKTSYIPPFKCPDRYHIRQAIKVCNEHIQKADKEFNDILEDYHNPILYDYLWSAIQNRNTAAHTSSHTSSVSKEEASVSIHIFRKIIAILNKKFVTEEQALKLAEVLCKTGLITSVFLYGSLARKILQPSTAEGEAPNDIDLLLLDDGTFSSSWLESIKYKNRVNRSLEEEILSYQKEFLELEEEEQNSLISQRNILKRMESQLKVSDERQASEGWKLNFEKNLMSLDILFKETLVSDCNKLGIVQGRLNHIEHELETNETLKQHLEQWLVATKCRWINFAILDAKQAEKDDSKEYVAEVTQYSRDRFFYLNISSDLLWYDESKHKWSQDHIPELFKKFSEIKTELEKVGLIYPSP